MSKIFQQENRERELEKRIKSEIHKNIVVMVSLNASYLYIQHLIVWMDHKL